MARGGAESAKYVYGVVPADSRARPKGSGIGGKSLRLVASGELAAITSDVPEGPLEAGRDELMAHSQVLAELLDAARAVLPMRFGVVMPSDDSVREELLDAFRPDLEAQLDEMDGKIEMNLKGIYDEAAVLREVVAENREIARIAGGDLLGSARRDVPRAHPPGRAGCGSCSEARGRRARGARPARAACDRDGCEPSHAGAHGRERCVPPRAWKTGLVSTQSWSASPRSTIRASASSSPAPSPRTASWSSRWRRDGAVQGDRAPAARSRTRDGLGGRPARAGGGSAPATTRTTSSASSCSWSSTTRTAWSAQRSVSGWSGIFSTVLPWRGRGPPKARPAFPSEDPEHPR